MEGLGAGGTSAGVLRGSFSSARKPQWLLLSDCSEALLCLLVFWTLRYD